MIAFGCTNATLSHTSFAKLRTVSLAGVSILRVDGPDSFQRISGTSIGGGTYWGLCRMLGVANRFDEANRLAMHGDSTKVDMLVG